MRSRLPFLVLLGGALTFLASLFLPWLQVRPSGGGAGTLGLLNLFASDGSVDGWATTAGVGASLAALALAAAAAAGLVRSGSVRRPPLTPIALAMLYLAIGNVLVLRAEETIYGPRLHLHPAYGMFLGLAAAGIGLLGALALEASAPRRRRAVEVLAALLGLGLLASCLLPWASPFGPARNLDFPGVTLPLVVLLTGGVCVLAGPALRSGAALYAALTAAVVTGAGTNAIWPETTRYGAWLALGFAIALIAVAALMPRRPRLARPSVAVGLGAAAAGVLVVSLFLPWQQFCIPGGRSYGPGIGACIGTTGWANAEPGAVTGILALLLIVGAFAAGPIALPPTEIVLGVATLVAATGASIGTSPGYRSWSFGYGAYIGFAATGILLFIALARVRPPRIETRHALVRLVPLAAAFAAFATVVLPLWSVLPDRWSREEVVLNGWYAVAGVLLAIHLARRWLESARRIPFPSDELVLLPLALLALTALALVRNRGEGMTWGGGILAGLCLLLAWLGWLESKGRLETLRIPSEIWRVDRLPGEG